MPEAASFTMSIRGNVTLNMMDYLKTLTAYTLGVQPERLINGFRTF